MKIFFILLVTLSIGFSATVVIEDNGDLSINGIPAGSLKNVNANKQAATDVEIEAAVSSKVSSMSSTSPSTARNIATLASQAGFTLTSESSTDLANGEIAYIAAEKTQKDKELVDKLAAQLDAAAAEAARIIAAAQGQ